MSKLRSCTHAAVAILALFVPCIGFAMQEVHTEPNGTVGFRASMTDLTRLSISGGRVRRVINDKSLFEMTNDETTGDVFLRFIGSDPTKAIHETGYIVTETGDTITYVLRPVETIVEPVILTISGGGATGSAQEALVTSAGFGDDIATTMADIVRAVYASSIEGRKAEARNGKTIESKDFGDWRARVIVITADKEFRRVLPSELAGAGTRGIWIQKADLGPKESTFAIIVEDK